MHRLERPPAPACLASYRPGRDTWDALHRRPADVHAVRASLSTMQQGLCAYCESAIAANGWHIEHFKPRSRFVQHTFDWDNLFGSCERRDSCGRYKDERGRPYEPSDLVDPCRDDPDDYLFFAADGTVQPKAMIQGAALRRAEATIRVFNLNAPTLREQRVRVLKMLLESEHEVLDLAREVRAEEHWAWFKYIFETYCAGCFPTPVRHLLFS